MILKDGTVIVERNDGDTVFAYVEGSPDGNMSEAQWGEYSRLVIERARAKFKAERAARRAQSKAAFERSRMV